jgi:hypothetical protein
VCPMLSELTVFYPHSGNTLAGGILPDGIGSAHSVISELVSACKALPDFDTLQIVHFLGTPLSPSSTEQWEQELTGQVKDWIDHLKKPRTRCREGEGRKKTTLRVIELSPDLSRPHLV